MKCLVVADIKRGENKIDMYFLSDLLYIFAN